MSPSINNNAGFTIILIGNYGLSKDCINWINNHKSSYNGIDATEGIANVFMLLPNNMNTKYGMRMIDVDGYWTKNAPGTEGEARKIQRSYEITSANIETCGSRATDGAFQGEFLKDGSPEWYLRERLEKSWLDAILQGKKECFCNDGDVESIRAAIISTQRALAHYPNIK